LRDAEPAFKSLQFSGRDAGSVTRGSSAAWESYSSQQERERREKTLDIYYVLGTLYKSLSIVEKSHWPDRA
jgi:hypothetical protein